MNENNKKTEEQNKEENKNDTPKFTTAHSENNIFDFGKNKSEKKEEESSFLKVPIKTETKKVEEAPQKNENVLFNEDAILYKFEDSKWNRVEQGSVAIVEEGCKKRYVFYVPSLGCMRHNFYVDFDMFGRVEKENVILVLPGSGDSVASTFLLKFRNVEFAKKFKNLIEFDKNL